MYCCISHRKTPDSSGSSLKLQGDFTLVSFSSGFDPTQVIFATLHRNLLQFFSINPQVQTSEMETAGHTLLPTESLATFKCYELSMKNGDT